MQVTERAIAQDRLSLPDRKGRGPWRDAWNQLLDNKAAIGGGVFIIFLVWIAIFADVVAPRPYDSGALVDNNLPPGAVSQDPKLEGFRYVLGADQLGRDILSRIIYGARISLSVAFIGSAVAFAIGLIYGLISGYSGGFLDNAMMRLVDIIYGYPFVIFLVLMQVYFKGLSRQHERTGGEMAGLASTLVRANNAMGGALFIYIAMGAVGWLTMARLVRSQVLAYKEKEFIEAARCIGVGHGRTLFRHILPNIIGPCIVAVTLAVPGFIFAEAFLSFIGLGINPPMPSWGGMINDGVKALRAHPHLITYPAIALSLTTLAFNFLGDGLRDALDPRLRS
jgi:oligopeptide transport system permease protein